MTWDKMVRREKRNSIIGLLLQISVSVIFVFLIFNTEITQSNSFIMLALPFGITIIIIGLIGCLIHRGCCSSYTGNVLCLFIPILAIIYTISIPIEEFHENIGMFFINIIAAIPGIIILSLTEDKEKN